MNNENRKRRMGFSIMTQHIRSKCFSALTMPHCLSKLPWLVR